MAISVFKRKEKKYIVDSEQRMAVEAAALASMSPDAYGQTLITSVYLDTPERSLIARSLEKPLYKEKLRLRTYGAHAGGALIMMCGEDGLARAAEAYGEGLLTMSAFFELKKKFKGVVYKRRVRLSLPAAWAFANGASFEAARSSFPLIEDEGEQVLNMTLESEALVKQIAQELEAALDRHENLQPSMAIICRRTAWAPLAETDEPRITFDEDVSYIDLTKSNVDIHPILDSGLSIMEVKASKAYPDWLIRALSSLSIYPQSFSKYGRAAQLAQQQPIEERRLVHV